MSIDMRGSKMIDVPSQRAIVIATMLLVAQISAGCGAEQERQGKQMQSDETTKRVEQRPTLVIRLGKPVPPLPADVEVERHAYSDIGDVLAIKNRHEITVVTNEGRRFTSPAELTKLFLSKGERVKSAHIWALPQPMPWLDAVDWFKDWLKTNKIESGENLRKKLEIWSNNDIPGNEAPRNFPRHDRSGTDLTPTSALSVLWKPHPVRDWVLVLGVGLTAEEMGKLREKEAANGEEKKADGDVPEGPLDEFRRWDETHGDIDIEKLLKNEDYGPFE